MRIKFDQKQKSLIILPLIILYLIFPYYGIMNNYALSDDLPVYIASIEELSDFSKKPGNPYFTTGKPDLHYGPYFFLVTILTIFPSNSGLDILDENSGHILKWIYSMGFVNSLFLFFSFLVFLKNYSKSYEIGIIGSFLLLFMYEFPLIRWAGNISSHGLMFSFYYSQTFSLALTFLTLWMITKYFQIRDKKWLLLSLIFLNLTFLSHILTGIFLLGLVYATISINFFKERKRSDLYLIIITLPLVLIISNFWPYYDVSEVLRSTNVTNLIILTYVLSIVTGIFILFRINLHSFFECVNLKRSLFVGVSLSMALFIYTLSQWSTGNIPTYLYSKYIDIWWLAFPTAIVGFFILPRFISDYKEKSYLILFWILMGIIPYILGVSGFQIKVYWRFLFFSLPAITMITSIYLYEGSKRKMKHIIILFALLIILITPFKIYEINNNPVADHFKNVPLEYSLSNILSKEQEGVVLSDPFTSYYIAGITKHTVVAVPPYKVTDYDFNDNLKRLYDVDLLFSANTESIVIEELISKYDISFIVLNKNYFYKIDKNSLETHKTKWDYLPATRTFREYFLTEFENKNYIILKRIN